MNITTEPNNTRKKGSNKRETSKKKKCKSFSSKKWYKKDCDKLGKKETVKDYRCEDFKYNLKGKNNDLIDHIQKLKDYVDTMEIYFKNLEKCSNGRNNYYESCINNNPKYKHTKSIGKKGHFTNEGEDIGHKHIRETLTKYKDECEKKLNYWKEEYERIINQ